MCIRDSPISHKNLKSKKFMEVPVDLYKRLAEKDLRLLPEPQKQVKGDRIVLPRQLQVPMESGFIAAQYFIKIEQVSV